MGPQPGDFGVQPGSGYAGYLIRLGTFSRYGHACVVVEPMDTGGEVRIVEAAPDGCRYSSVPVDAFVWSRCDLSHPQRMTIVIAARKCIGLPYDWRDIGGFVARFLGAKTKIFSSRNHPNDKLICSELVAWCYRQGGHEVAPTPATAPGDVSPGDLADHTVREGR